jgi:hypothetical protein
MSKQKHNNLQFSTTMQRTFWLLDSYFHPTAKNLQSLQKQLANGKGFD